MKTKFNKYGEIEEDFSENYVDTKSYKLEGMALWGELVRAGVPINHEGFVIEDPLIITPKDGGLTILYGRVEYIQDVFPNLDFSDYTQRKNSKMKYKTERRSDKNEQ
jgi:hypothetical protein